MSKKGQDYEVNMDKSVTVCEPISQELIEQENISKDVVNLNNTGIGYI